MGENLGGPFYLEMFTVYERPRDYPDKFVVRRWWIGKELGKPTPDADWFYVADTLEEVRARVPAHCVRMERHPSDDLRIVEVWI
jgi:hypothetical protein